MNRLTTEVKSFRAIDGGTMPDPVQREKTLANFMAVQTLHLRVDAQVRSVSSLFTAKGGLTPLQVMLIKNMDDNLVNGSMGRVVRFCDQLTYGTDRDIEGSSGEVLGAAAGPAKKPTGAAAGVQYPVVEFSLPNGGKRALLVLPETFKVEQPSGEITASRSQVYLFRPSDVVPRTEKCRSSL
ncbi:hypothetical protein DFH07DRAFT_395473 [Mycena maculata]|uniref:Uncharacterized protein n=1 Tax=Mycena maculata TaxID=230809 RepID=A0AAD7JF21_9AGAR|nr:hypothetical protein DFH07DRAFT_395473 [Mycena maculata]